MEVNSEKSTSDSKRKYPRREFSQNLQHHLWDRESDYNRRSCRHRLLPFAFEHEFHKCFTPNLTIQNVDKPLGYLRKFTPDGSKLLSFSQDQRSLEVFDYRGATCAAPLLQRQYGECITAADHSIESLHVRQNIFRCLFRRRFTLRLAVNEHAHCQINREFSIYLDNGNYVLLVGMARTTNLYVPVSYTLQYPDLHDNLEILNFIFFLVDLREGFVSDTHSYTFEDIFLSHNHGVSVHENTIAILSKLRQCIDVKHVVQGKLVHLYTLGPWSRTTYIERELQTDIVVKPMLTPLKQSVISYLYREILEVENETRRRSELREFYKCFRIFEKMFMVKMQLLDTDHILIRYEEPQNQPNVSDAVLRSTFRLYVFYSIKDERVMRVFKNDSIELLNMLRNFSDNFRNVRSLQTQRPPSSTCNNAYFRSTFTKGMHSIQGGLREAALRYNITLPISAQSFATSQLLNYNLFKFDDRFISAFERPKLHCSRPLRFSDRNTDITKFRLFLEAPSAPVDARSTAFLSRELVAYIIHPYEPFIISVQKLSTRYVVNFHIYNESTVVQP